MTGAARVWASAAAARWRAHHNTCRACRAAVPGDPVAMCAEGWELLDNHLAAQQALLDTP
jgi:hypothetical protein